MKSISIYAVLLALIFCTSLNGQITTRLPTATINSNTKEIITSHVPNSITRNIIQDKKGNIWMAAFDGVFRYDGKLFTHVTKGVSTARFFSLLEDRKGAMWFGSIGYGVYYFDGMSFKNITTKDGLINNEITCLYEDRRGNIWIGVNGGVSRYDGKSFQNFMMSGDSLVEDKTGKTFKDFTRPPNEINSIVEDRKGKYWIATRGKTFIYDGKTFTGLSTNGTQFANVRTIIEDRKGDIWFSGSDGLWRYDGSTFTNITKNFVGYVYEDKNGNIWTSSESDNGQGWVLSRYDEKTLSTRKPTVTEINPREGRMLFGILEDNKGNIWFGADGVYRYDGNTITDFKN